MKKLLVSLLAIAGLVACTNDEVVNVQKGNPITFDSFVENATRANDPSTTTNSLNAFRAWAYMDNTTGVVLNDELVEKVGSVWSYVNTQYWMPGHTYYFAALAPVNGNWTLNTEAANNYGAGIVDFINEDGSEDLLYAATAVESKESGNLPVKFQFSHLLSKINFTFVNGFATSNVDVEVKNVTMTAPASASINLAVENWWDNNDDWKNLPVANDLTLAFGDVVRLDAGQSATATDERLTIPASAEREYKVEFDIVVYSGEVPSNFHKTATIKGVAFEMGKAYNLTATISPESLDLEAIEFEVAVNEWEQAGNDVSVSELQAAAILGGEYTLTEDLELTTPLEVAAPFTLNLDGNTLTGAIELAEGVELTINDGTIVNGDKSVSGITSNGELTLNNVNIESARHAVRVESGKVYIYGGEYKVKPVSKSTLHALNVGDDNTNAEVYIYGGTFKGPKGTDADSGSAVNVRSGSKVEIYGGDFSGGKTKTLANGGTLTVKGGTFDQDPAAFVADGYKVIEKNSKYYVVAEEVDNVVASKKDVQDALKDAAAAGETEVVIDANGANINLDYGLNTTTVPAGTTVTIRNANVEGKSKNNYANGTVIFEGCTFNNASGPYSIHFDGGTGDVIFKNCKLYGWNSFAGTLNSVSFENCTLDGNGIYALIRSYANLTLTNCVINTSNAIHNDSWPEGIQIIAPATLTENNVTYVAENPEALKDALANGENVVLTQDITTEAATTAPYGNKYAFKLDGGVIDGNGHELYMECYGDDYGIMTSGGTIKNVTIKEGCRAVMIMSPQTDVILDNVKIGGDGVLYPINTGEAGAEGVNLVVTNSVLAGWTSYGLIESATFTNVEFKQGTYYNDIYGRVLKPYVNTTLTNCSFVEHMNLDLSSLGMGHKIVMKNCTVNGQAVTAATFTVPTTDAQYDTELFTIDLPSWASSINDCVVFE